MRYLSSALATTAIALAGVVAASHVLYPADSATRPTAPIAAVAPAWVDPPYRVEPALVPPTSAAEAALATAVARDLGPLLAPVWMGGRAPALDAAGRVDQRKADAAPRRRVADAKARRIRTARAPRPAPAQEATPAQAKVANTFDPIGALLRGFGLGRDS